MHMPKEAARIFIKITDVMVLTINKVKYWIYRFERIDI